MMLKKKLEFFVFLILLGVQVLSAQDVSDSDVSLPENVAYEEVVDKENDVRHIHIKTNVVGWGLLVANLAGEIDLDRHWSFALPLYYSGIDYFSSRTKFRTFTVQPEIRYWFDANHSGWFVGAHLGLSCFNIAWGGEYRYQGYDRNTPALGGEWAADTVCPLLKTVVGGWNFHWEVAFTH